MKYSPLVSRTSISDSESVDLTITLAGGVTVKEDK